MDISQVWHLGSNTLFFGIAFINTALLGVKSALSTKVKTGVSFWVNYQLYTSLIYVSYLYLYYFYFYI